VLPVAEQRDQELAIERPVVDDQDRGHEGTSVESWNSIFEPRIEHGGNTEKY
jgi:hypothetical protein